MKVAIIMGSDSDFEIMKKAVEVLRDFNIEIELTVASAHRTPGRVREFVENCVKNDVKVFIAGAGCAAHLAGVVAAYTTRPVIGVPIASAPFDGWDSLLSTVQMPGGIPVATVAVNGAKNAALLAAQILSVSNSEIEKKLLEYRESMAKEVEVKSERVMQTFKEM